MQSNQRIIKIIVLLALVVGIIAGVGVVYGVIFNKVVLTVEPAAGTRTIINKASENSSPLVVDTTINVSQTVSKGTYTVTFSGDTYQQKTSYITVNKNTTIQTPVLLHSPDYLITQLPKESAAAQKAFIGLPQLAGYTVVYQSLYEQGDWYGAVLLPKDPTTQDILRIILNKNDKGTWETSAGPSIVFYTGKYPSIPPQVVKAVSNKQL